MDKTHATAGIVYSAASSGVGYYLTEEVELAAIAGVAALVVSLAIYLLAKAVIVDHD